MGSSRSTGESPARLGVRWLPDVHTHDTAEADGRVLDHRPLGAGFCPWREYFAALAEAGFDGRILLEVGLWTADGYDALAHMLHHAATEIDPIFAPSP